MEWQELISRAPESCGVYIFRNRKRYLYIGKAKNIRKRLHQHLKLSQTDPKESAVFAESTQLEWIVTRNEFEALVLEIDLIQLHKPRYNVLHKYGGGYPMLLITEDSYPTVTVVRGTDHAGQLFGPFLQARKAHRVKKLIHKLFRLRTCDPMPRRSEPCMDYHLGLCSAPCAGLISREDYALSVESAKALLSGEVSSVLPRLYERVEELSREMLFEKCAQIRDQIRALENIVRGQSVSGLPFRSADLFYRLGSGLGLFLIRGGKLFSREIYDLGRDDEVEEFLLGYYYANRVPETILSNFPIPEDVKRWIERRRGDVSFSGEIPEELAALAEENLKESAGEIFRREIERQLGVEVQVIEGFDVSHFQGEGTVGSCVVWENGRMNRKRYRRYRIREGTHGDDYAALREVLSRRARRLAAGAEPAPDMWLVDGGRGQLSVALEVRDRYGLSVYVTALAKEEEILLTEDGREIPLREEPLLYRVFGLIRDEAHRFALSYSRKLRSRKVLEDVLSRVKGVGEVRRRIIYRNFEDLYDFVEADEETLRKLGLPPHLRQEVRKYLEGGEDL